MKKQKDTFPSAVSIMRAPPEVTDVFPELERHLYKGKVGLGWKSCSRCQGVDEARAQAKARAEAGLKAESGERNQGVGEGQLQDVYWQRKCWRSCFPKI